MHGSRCNKGVSVSYFEPLLPLFLLLGFIATIRAWKKSRKERPWVQTASTIGLFLISLNAFAWLCSRPLEMWYSQDPMPRGTAGAIVVLAGSVNSPLPNRPYAFAGQDTYVRLQRAVWLFKNWKAVPVLACGGGADAKWYADTMRHVLESEGISQDLIWIESRSRSTHENAVYCAEILRQHGISSIAIVVDASSMLRAKASFQKQGFSVIPSPARYTHLSREISDFIPSWQAIALNGETLHEMAGLLWYWLHGWI